jgi:hypothetical protein
MGLDISAYSKTASNFLKSDEEVSEEEREQLYESAGVARISANSSFEDQLDGYQEGFYRVKGKSTGFRAGSYSGYNWWRRHLCLMALELEPDDVWSDPEVHEGRPFVELINFSDCEGCIGPETSKKLLADFRAHAEKAEAYAKARAPGNPNRPDEDEDTVHPWWLENYKEWTEAFELAADDGFVSFH